MERPWLETVTGHLRHSGPVCRVVVVKTRGSAPREAGAEMLVHADYFLGTVGGGALEYEAIGTAREQLRKWEKRGFRRLWKGFALGPSLGQCCGGFVTMMFESFQPSDLPALEALAGVEAEAWLHKGRMDLPRPAGAVSAPQAGSDPQQAILPARRGGRAFFLYGAGHVGRALIDVTGGLGLDRNWVDTHRERFPEAVPDDVGVVPAADMAVVARHAPAGAYHVVMTYSHRLDEEIVHAVLAEGGFGRLGLIGSETKCRRFKSSLAKSGIGGEALDRLVCPVGLPEITGKAPARVALSIAAQIAVWLDEDG